MSRIMIFITSLFALAAWSAMAAGVSLRPWPDGRWVATAVQNANGHRLTTTIRGGGNSNRVTVSCADLDMSTGRTRTFAGRGAADEAQDDYEGDVHGVGTFGIRSPEGKELRWFENPTNACATGRITWWTQR